MPTREIPMRRPILGLAAVLCLAWTQSTSAMMGWHGKGNPKVPVSCSNWPEGIAELANRKDRSGGYWVNASDWFHYNGDVVAFNDFLARYATLKSLPPRL